MYLVVESYDCYNVSEDTWSYVRYICCTCLYLELMTVIMCLLEGVIDHM